MEPSHIQDFYRGKNFFITGATGFVGIALVEKILRSLPDVGKIYLLIRPKRGKEAEERLEEYTKNAIFETLTRAVGTDIFNKLVAVAGDVGEDNLGLSPKDRQKVIDNVNVVVHSAATLDFEANLKTTVSINLLGTRRVIQLCKEIKSLSALLHVSSAYVNSNMKDPLEMLYPVPGDAQKVIEIATSYTDEEAERITPQVLGTHLNTYTFTKALAEHEVAKSNESFPTCIVRPSMIVAAWKEPVPGWTISKNGPQGFIMGASKGVIRRLPMDENLISDYIPVDVVVNGIITGAYDAATKRPSSTPVYHLTSSSYKPFRWSLVIPKMYGVIHRYPLEGAVWYPHLKLLPSVFWFRVSAIIFHLLPAYFLDTVTFLAGGRPILRKLHSNVSKSLDRLEPFIFTEWRYDNKQTLILHNSLNQRDKALFNLDIGSIDWPDFFENLVKGVRLYLHNEKPSTIPAGKKKDTFLWIMNYAVQGAFLFGVYSLLSFVGSLTGIPFQFMFPLVFISFLLL